MYLSQYELKATVDKRAILSPILFLIIAKHTKINEMKFFSVNDFWLLNDKLMTSLENSQAKVLGGGKGEVRCCSIHTSSVIVDVQLNYK